ncbi:hypothetical protein CSPAE12_02575 [Colletotrichum incanum]|nr:hypothetical protein CSPAE12_02575 [Colletotrichum incanum]
MLRLSYPGMPQRELEEPTGDFLSFFKPDLVLDIQLGTCCSEVLVARQEERDRFSSLYHYGINPI